MTNQTKTPIAKIDRDMQWLIVVVITVAIPIVGFQWKQSSDIAVVMSSVPELRQSLDRLTTTVQDLLRNDVSDIKSRLAVLEQRKMMPGAEHEIEKLNVRVREIETKIK